MQPLIDHWRTCFGLLRLRVPADEEFDRLIGRYYEPHRAYHTIQHIEECFREFEAVPGLANSPSAVGGTTSNCAFDGGFIVKLHSVYSCFTAGSGTGSIESPDQSRRESETHLPPGEGPIP